MLSLHLPKTRAFQKIQLPSNSLQGRLPHPREDLSYHWRNQMRDDIKENCQKTITPPIYSLKAHFVFPKSLLFFSKCPFSPLPFPIKLTYKPCIVAISLSFLCELMCDQTCLFSCFCHFNSWAPKDRTQENLRGKRFSSPTATLYSSLRRS